MAFGQPKNWMKSGKSPSRGVDSVCELRRMASRVSHRVGRVMLFALLL